MYMDKEDNSQKPKGPRKGLGWDGRVVQGRAVCPMSLSMVLTHHQP